MRRSSKVMLLVSGGMDSTACVDYYLYKEYDVIGVFVDYGQKSMAMERASAERIASHYGIHMQKLSFNARIKYGEGEILGRNAFLLFSAMMANPKFSGILSIGIHSDSPYYDCSVSFSKTMKRFVQEYSDGRIVLDVPFLHWNKRMIFDYCRKRKVPLQLTYSCEKGGKTPCGTCQSCLDIGALHAV